MRDLMKMLLSISKSLSKSFLNVSNRNFSEKLSSNSLSKWLFKYRHLLFRNFHYPKIEDAKGSV